MGPRRTHKKSRAGCRKCKQRRIKCDEVHPTCTNCRKHAIPCDFELPPPQATTDLTPPADGDATGHPPPPLVVHDPQLQTQGQTQVPSPQAAATLPPLQSTILPPPHPPPPRPQQQQQQQQQQQAQTFTAFTPPHSTTSAANSVSPSLSHPHLPPISPHFAVLQPHQPAQHPPTPAPDALHASPSAPPELNMSDLSLMHNWTFACAKTICNQREIQLLWLRNIPELAVQTPFLMHALLAVSALHLYSSQASPDPSLLPLAAHHHQLAVRQIAVTLADINQRNCDALVVSSCLVVIYSFVASRLDAREDPFTSLATWMPLLRGINSILQQSWEWVLSGPLAPLIRQYQLPPPDPSRPGLDPEIDGVLASLFRLATDTSLPSSEELQDTSVSTAYFSAIAELRKSYASVDQWEDIIGAIFIWPITASDKFVELLVQRRPRALIIFVHYCALFTLTEEFWWSQGSARFELARTERILKSMDRGEEWEKWIEWPKRAIEKGDVQMVEVRGKPEKPGGEALKGKGLAAGEAEGERRRVGIDQMLA